MKVLNLVQLKILKTNSNGKQNLKKKRKKKFYLY